MDDAPSDGDGTVNINRIGSVDEIVKRLRLATSKIFLCKLAQNTEPQQANIVD